MAPGSSPDGADLGRWLSDAVDSAGIPGAALAVLRGDELIEAQAGVLDLETGDPVTSDTVFQVGSTTKLITAALVLQLVDAGLVELARELSSCVDALTNGVGGQ